VAAAVVAVVPTLSKLGHFLLKNRWIAVGKAAEGCLQKGNEGRANERVRRKLKSNEKQRKRHGVHLRLSERMNGSIKARSNGKHHKAQVQRMLHVDEGWAPITCQTIFHHGVRIMVSS